jgi:dipeptidyl-peptidase-4
MHIYTNRNHGIFGGKTRNHLMRRVAEHFINNK